MSVANRASTGSEKDSLAPPPSPYPATVDPSPVESNDSHSTDVTDIDAVDVQSPNPADGLKSPDIEIMSPASGMSADEVAVRVCRPECMILWLNRYSHYLK